MLNQLFKQPHALARHRAGPLLEERLAFLAYLANRGLPPGTLQRVARDLLRIANTLGLANRPGQALARDEIKRKGSGKRGFLPLASRWLQFLGRLQQPPAPCRPFAAKIKAFADYMAQEQGLAAATIRGRCWLVPRFLHRLDTAGGSLRAITPERIDEALREMLSQGAYARVSIGGWASTLRAFFRFAERRGWCCKGLAASIRGPRLFAQASLPVGPSWDVVRRLLATTEGDRPADIRDRAILLLLAVYGLRAAEVQRLRLEDLDWERERLLVTCPKNGQARTYPLTRPVGDAILRYLREVRPRAAHRAVFLTLRAPARPLSGLWAVVGPRLRPLGVSLPHHGPHALRHACAMRLLAQGLSLKEIGDHLGHRDPDATRVYAKVDLVGLRQVADFNLGGLL
jgi:integrase/recombinase XerD